MQKENSYQFIIGTAKKIWPWPERHLAVLVCSLASADYASTVAFLKLSTEKGAYEAGVLAGRAFEKGGFLGLLLNDAAAITIMLLTAFIVRRLCLRSETFKGFSHVCFVLAVMPYVVTASAAILNNIWIVIS